MQNKIVFTESGKHGLESAIVALEQRLATHLPVSYRQFLFDINGGRPEPNAFKIQDNPNDTHGLLERFFSLDDADADYDISDNIDVFQNRIPGNLLPIAFDPGGNLLCIAVSGENVGKIYFWDHNDECEIGAVPDYHNIYFVANDFSELLDNLTELSDW